MLQRLLYHQKKTAISQKRQAKIETGLWCKQAQGSRPEPSGLLDQREGIDDCFSAGSCEGIYAALQDRADPWSKDTLKALQKYVTLTSLIWYCNPIQASPLHELILMSICGRAVPRYLAITHESVCVASLPVASHISLTICLIESFVVGLEKDVMLPSFRVSQCMVLGSQTEGIILIDCEIPT